MIYIKDNDNILQNQDTAIMLGNFDGIHLGHQALYAKLNEYANKKMHKKVLFSFSPHPSEYFMNKTFYTLLTSAEKAKLFESMGADIFVEYPFTDAFAKIEPENFVREILFEKMKCKTLIIGEDYRFGKNQKGNHKFLSEKGQKLGIEVIIVSNVTINGIKISSTQIRKFVEDKDFQNAEHLMGRPFLINGPVVSGRQIGRTIGFPTVNLFPGKNKLLPSNGVYITKTHFNGKIFNSITNIGVNPTVQIKEKRVETHMFDFNENIYGKDISIYFYKWIRYEVKFDNFEDLKKRISLDVLEGKKYFDEENRIGQKSSK